VAAPADRVAADQVLVAVEEFPAEAVPGAELVVVEERATVRAAMVCRVQIFGKRGPDRAQDQEPAPDLGLVVDRGPEAAGAQDQAVDRGLAPAAEQVAQEAVRVAREEMVRRAHSPRCPVL